MLYVNTRDRTDSYTPNRTLREDTAGNGGLFVPFRLPVFSREDLRLLLNQSRGEIIARVLSVFFVNSIKASDIDLILGKQPFRTIQMSHRIFIAEFWQDKDHDYTCLERSLYALLSGKEDNPTHWAKIVIRIAVMFALCSELREKGIRQFDVAVTASDNSAPAAAYYAKTMGLPIETIVYCCNEESNIWNLVNKGEFFPAKTPLQQRTFLERLIYERLGYHENNRYLDKCAAKGAYQIDEEQRVQLFDGFEIAVASKKRCQSLIRNIYKTHRYSSNPHMALAYGGLQDYRACSGEVRTTLLLSDACASSSADPISDVFDQREEKKSQ